MSLQRNLRINNLDALVASHFLVVVAEPGRLRITAGRGPMNRVVTGSSLLTAANTLEATVEVSVITTHQLLTGPRLLWKVDVECFEPRVLLEADTPALQAVMADSGLSPYVFEPFSRLLQLLGATT